MTHPTPPRSPDADDRALAEDDAFLDLDPRWAALTEGTLPPEMLAELERSGRDEGSESAELHAVALEALRPLASDVRERLVNAAVERFHQGRATRRTRSWVLVPTGLALAASV